jgi:hypothetical protein
MSETEVERKVVSRSYWTLESETIIFASTIYAVLSLILVGVVFRFWLPASLELCVISIYAIFSLIFVSFIGVQSRRRTKLNKLPSRDILELCYLVKEGFSESMGVTCDSFNGHAMKRLFSTEISQIILPHDYFSYMLAERYIDISGFTDKGSDINKNTLNIYLSKSAQEKLEIYEGSAHW